MAKILIETRTGMNKSRIISKCNLSHKQLNLYLKILIKKKLLARIVNKKGKETFETTKKGKNFVNKFHYLQIQLDKKHC